MQILHHLWGTGGVSSQETTRSSQASGSELKPLWEPIPSGGVEPRGDVLAYVRDTSTNCFSSNGSYVPPLVAPILIGHRADSHFKKFGHLVSWFTHFFMQQTLNTYYVPSSMLSSGFIYFFFNYIACLFPKCLCSTMECIMKINNNSYHFEHS